MFTNMKNQFREKTGKEVPKFTPQKGGLSRQSRQGSESSVCSLVLDNPPQTSQQPIPPQPSSSPSGLTPDPQPIKLADGKVLSNKDVNILSKKEEEWRNRMEKKEAEWMKKMEKKEMELMEKLAQKENDWTRKEQILTEDLLKQTNELKEALRTAEDLKRKICQYQEEKDTLDEYQTQEMSKIKHLLLAKEKECSEGAASLKETTTMIENLKSEVNRLRPFEEQVSNFQDDLEMLRHTSEKERWHLSSKLAQSEEQVRHLTDRVAVLTRRSESDAGLASALPADDRIQALIDERVLLERRLEEAHVHLSDIKEKWSAKISTLETQVGRLSRQAGEEGAERRSAEAKVSELEAKLEEEMKEQERLKSRIAKLTEECNTLADDLKTSNGLVVLKDGDISNLSKEIHDVVNESGRLKDEKKALEEQNLIMKANLEKLEDELATLKGEMVEEKSRWENELKMENEKCKTMEEELLRERSAKDEALLRNAQVSQDADMTKQALRQQQIDVEEYIKQASVHEDEKRRYEQEILKHTESISSITDQLEQLKRQLESKQDQDVVEKGLRAKIADLEEQTTEKNKSIKVMQHKLNDLKKTLREMKVADNNGGTEVMNNHNHSVISSGSTTKTSDDPEVNFLYMKNVIMKFLTSREYEALHLTKAVATLLKLTYEEECLLRDTIDWRMSWFRLKPRPKDYTPS